MRVVHLLKHCQRGNGSVHVAVDLACAQVVLGHEVWLVSARNSYSDLLKDQGVKVLTVSEPVNIRSGLASLFELARVVRSVRPDVMHAHMMSSVVIARILKLLYRIPLVATMHNSFDGHSALMRLADRVVAVSAAEERLLLSRGYPPSKVEVVLNGDMGSPRESLPLDNHRLPLRPSVMTLSGLHGRKAVDEVIRAFSAVQVEYPEWHLNVVGDGPDRRSLELLAEGLGLSDRVHFLGATLVPHRMLESSEVFAHAAHAEPFGLAVAEARAAGCAIVASATGGIPEVLDNGAAGILVAVGDEVAFAHALRSLMENRVTLKYWRDAALRGAEVFSVHRVARDYERVYRSVRRTGGNSVA